MQEVQGYPPNFEEIAQVFPEARKPGVIFAYGDTIYVPSGEALSLALLAHEEVHGRRQLAQGVDAWWRQYLIDAEFRFNEELPAHKAEYKEFCAAEPNRNIRSQYLHHVADRLAGPLYGVGITAKQARQRILDIVR